MEIKAENRIIRIFSKDLKKEIRGNSSTESFNNRLNNIMNMSKEKNSNVNVELYSNKSALNSLDNINKYNGKNLNNNMYTNFVEVNDRVIKTLECESNIPEEVKSAIAVIENNLNMRITGADYKENGKLDIMSIISNHGSKLSRSSYNTFKESIKVLWKNDIIDTSDFIEANKWLSLQMTSQKIEKIADDELYNIFKEINNNKR